MTPWPIVYRQISFQLNKLGKASKDDPGHRLFKLLINDQKFNNNNQWLGKISIDFNITSLDPIHVFACFNFSRQKYEKRLDNINNILHVLGASSYFDDIDFTGCPTPFRTNSPRGLKSQFQIWDYFRYAHNSSNKAINERTFDDIKDWFGIDTVTFTTFLFWIDPTYFIPLDSNTIQYCLSVGLVSSRPRTAIQYLQLLDLLRGEENLKIVETAYQRRPNTYSTSQRRVKSVYQDKESDVVEEKKSELYLQDFRIIGLRFHEKFIKEKLRKTLKEDLYFFYKCYEITSEDVIRYRPDLDLNLYSNEDLQVNISAIVGPNGAGKSTITELIYAIVNNVAFHNAKLKKDLILVRDMFLDFYIKTDRLYQIIIKDEVLEVYQYVYENENYL